MIVRDVDIHLTLIVNFATEDEREERTSELGFDDLWKKVYPDLPGFTYDPETNVMLKETLSAKGRSDEPHRFGMMWIVLKTDRIDLILYKQLTEKANWEVESIEMIGTKEIEVLPPPKGTVYPSDHFGVSTVLQTK